MRYIRYIQIPTNMNKPNLEKLQAKSGLVMALILTYEDYVATTHTNRMIQFYELDTEEKLVGKKDSDREEKIDNKLSNITQPPQPNK